ncbi:MAG: ATP-binding cassette domain-containing protein [Thermodesulfobacteriota bacterium]|nr:ATP-binding cassette domain-containing protein [Thermodesulfobacteriota bacterium]
MKELFRLLSLRRSLTFELSVATLFINILVFADTLYVMIVLRRYIAHGFDGTLLLLTLGVLAAVFMQFILREARTVIAGMVGKGHDRKTSDPVFTVFSKADFQALEQLPKDQSQQIAGALQDVHAAYEAPNINAVMDAPFSLVFVAAAYVLSPILALIVLVGMAGSLLTGLLSEKQTREPIKHLQQVSSENRGLVGSTLFSADTVRVFLGGAFYKKLWKDQTRKLAAVRRKLADTKGLTQSLSGTISVFVRVAVYAVGAKLVVNGDLTFAALIGASILASYAVQGTTSFVRAKSLLLKADEGSVRIQKFLSLPLEPEHGETPRESSGELVFQELSFSFPGADKPLFSSLNVTLKPGSALIVQGYNGSGKTTLARMVAGLLKPTEGKILIHGTDLREMDSGWWRGQIIYMPQEPFFLAGTIRENLTMANPGLDAASLNRIIRAVGLRRFLDTSEKGLETMLARNGRDLSLGIRRRLALARALATDGNLAVLDEPTEGLDPEGAQAVYAVMNDLAKRGKTIIAFTHDRNIVKGANFILDLSEKPAPRLTLVREPTPKADSPEGGGA